jgi:predicted RNase H-like nuclease (RuvC/YqgF family)
MRVPRLGNHELAFHHILLAIVDHVQKKDELLRFILDHLEKKDDAINKKDRELRAMQEHIYTLRIDLEEARAATNTFIASMQAMIPRISIPQTSEM